MSADDYDKWKRELDIKTLPIARMLGAELVVHTRHDKSMYASVDEDIEYPDGEAYRLVCKCGSGQFAVYAVQNYETRVRCLVCGNDQCVHSG